VQFPSSPGPERGATPRGRVSDAFVVAALLLTALGVGFVLDGGRGQALALAITGAAVAVAWLAPWRAGWVAAAVAALAYIGIEAHYGGLGHSRYWTIVLFVSLILGTVLASAYARLTVRARDAGLERAVAHIDEITSENALEHLLSGSRNLTSLEYEVARSRRHNHRFSLVMVRPDDIDDVAMRRADDGVHSLMAALAETIGAHVRATDVPFRHAAYDFCVLLPETTAAGARVAAERIRLAVHGRRVEFAPGDLVDLSVSIGIAAFPDDASSDEELTRGASLALSKAVELGGNRTVLHSAPPGAPPGWGMPASPIPAPPA